MEKLISSGSASFLVIGEDIKKGWDSEFFEFLKSKGFSSWKMHGTYNGISWVYVNINSKIFAPGMPGIKITIPIGNHAITIDEFKKIYSIYEKYDGYSPLVLKKEK